MFIPKKLIIFLVFLSQGHLQAIRGSRAFYGSSSRVRPRLSYNSKPQLGEKVLISKPIINKGKMLFGSRRATKAFSFLKSIAPVATMIGGSFVASKVYNSNPSTLATLIPLIASLVGSCALDKFVCGSDFEEVIKNILPRLLMAVPAGFALGKASEIIGSIGKVKDVVLNADGKRDSFVSGMTSTAVEGILNSLVNKLEGEKGVPSPAAQRLIEFLLKKSSLKDAVTTAASEMATAAMKDAIKKTLPTALNSIIADPATSGAIKTIGGQLVNAFDTEKEKLAKNIGIFSFGKKLKRSALGFLGGVLKSMVSQESAFSKVIKEV